MGDANLSTDALDAAFAAALGADYTRADAVKQDAQAQGDFLLQRAFEAGYDSIETFASEVPTRFAQAAHEWRSRGALDSPDRISGIEKTYEDPITKVASAIPSNSKPIQTSRDGRERQAAHARLETGRRAEEAGREIIEEQGRGTLDDLLLSSLAAKAEPDPTLNELRAHYPRIEWVRIASIMGEPRMEPYLSAWAAYVKDPSRASLGAYIRAANSIGELVDMQPDDYGVSIEDEGNIEGFHEDVIYELGERMRGKAQWSLLEVGTEASAFRDRDNGNVYKILYRREGGGAGVRVAAIKESGNTIEEIGATPVPIVDHLSDMRNKFAGLTFTEVVGVTESGDLITKQPYINGRKITPDDVRTWAKKWGHAVLPPSVGQTKTATPVLMRGHDGTYGIAFDLRGDNGFVQNREVHIFDPAIYPLTTSDKKIPAIRDAIREMAPPERFGAPDTAPGPLRNKDIRKRVKNSSKKDIETRARGLAPEITGRAENGPKVVLGNAWSVHTELRKVAFPAYKKLRDRGYEGSFEEFYREFTDTPITPQEAETFLDNYGVEFAKKERNDLDPDSRGVVDSYVLHEIYEAKMRLDRNVANDTSTRDLSKNEVRDLKEKLERDTKKLNDASALEAGAKELLRGKLKTFKSALGARGGAAKLGRLGEIIRQLEGMDKLDNRIARKYLVGIEQVLAGNSGSLADHFS